MINTVGFLLLYTIEQIAFYRFRKAFVYIKNLINHTYNLRYLFLKTLEHSLRKIGSGVEIYFHMVIVSLFL